MSLRVVRILVHPEHDRDVLLLAGRGDDDLARSRVEVLRGRVAVPEEAGGLDDDVDAESFTATKSMSSLPLCFALRRTLRPMRPNPLIATRMAMLSVPE